MAALLSQRYPLLKILQADNSDLAMLVQIAELVGSKMVADAGESIGACWR